MNVLQIVPELNAGGVEQTTLEITEALNQAGHQAHIVSLGGQLESQLIRLGGQLHRYPVGIKNPFLWPKVQNFLTKLISTHNINLIHARSRAPAWPAYRAAQKTACSFVTTYHGIYKDQGGIKRRYNKIMAQGDIVIANSKFTKAHILATHNTDPDKIIVIPRAVDISYFDPKNISVTQVQHLRQTWHIPPTHKILLLPARLSRWKGHDIAIAALPHLPEYIHLVILGHQHRRQRYIRQMYQQADHLGVAARVHIHSHNQNMPAALMAADIVIAPTHRPEAFGRVLIEAQAMQRPLIASAHGGALENIIDQLTGFLIPPHTPMALAEKITHIFTNNLYDPHAAREHIKTHYSKAALQKATLAAYTHLFQRTPH